MVIKSVAPCFSCGRDGEASVVGRMFTFVCRACGLLAFVSLRQGLFAVLNGYEYLPSPSLEKWAEGVLANLSVLQTPQAAEGGRACP